MKLFSIFSGKQKRAYPPRLLSIVRCVMSVVRDIYYCHLILVMTHNIKCNIATVSFKNADVLRRPKILRPRNDPNRCRRSVQGKLLRSSTKNYYCDRHHRQLQPLFCETYDTFTPTHNLRLHARTPQTNLQTRAQTQARTHTLLHPDAIVCCENVRRA